jgi:flagellar basal body-associated protein FliL
LIRRAVLMDDSMTRDQKKSNRSLGLILASVAVVFFLGFVFKMAVLGA